MNPTIKAKKTINEIIEKSVETTNNWGITNKHPSNNKMKQVIEKLNNPLRKVAHASEYLILTILLMGAKKILLFQKSPFIEPLFYNL